MYSTPLQSCRLNVLKHLKWEHCSFASDLRLIMSVIRFTEIAAMEDAKKGNELIYLYFHHPSIKQLLFLSCRPFVVITTLLTGLVCVEVTTWYLKVLKGNEIGRTCRVFPGKDLEVCIYCNWKSIVITSAFTF